MSPEDSKHSNLKSLAQTKTLTNYNSAKQCIFPGSHLPTAGRWLKGRGEDRSIHPGPLTLDLEPPVSFFLVGTPNCMLGFCFCVQLLTWFEFLTSITILLWPCLLDFWILPLPFHLDRDILGPNLILWTHGNIMFSNSSLYGLVNSVTAHYTDTSLTSFYLNKTLIYVT